MGSYELGIRRIKCSPPRVSYVPPYNRFSYLLSPYPNLAVPYGGTYALTLYAAARHTSDKKRDTGGLSDAAIHQLTCNGSQPHDKHSSTLFTTPTRAQSAADGGDGPRLSSPCTPDPDSSGELHHTEFIQHSAALSAAQSSVSSQQSILKLKAQNQAKDSRSFCL